MIWPLDTLSNHPHTQSSPLQMSPQPKYPSWPPRAVGSCHPDFCRSHWHLGSGSRFTGAAKNHNTRPSFLAGNVGEIDSKNVELHQVIDIIWATISVGTFEKRTTNIKFQGCQLKTCQLQPYKQNTKGPIIIEALLVSKWLTISKFRKYTASSEWMRLKKT